MSLEPESGITVEKRLCLVTHIQITNVNKDLIELEAKSNEQKTQCHSTLHKLRDNIREGRVESKRTVSQNQALEKDIHIYINL